MFTMTASSISRSTDAVQLHFTLPQKVSVGFRVFDLTGKVIARRAPVVYEAGVYTIAWNMFASANRAVANGTYVLLLEGNHRYTSHQILRIIR
ncbi:MAG: hypothetical protein JW863_08665 [Chitinispirillaceae bacterium]|nr:hypothetical protein [Chitinispirillaceae bacterium]